MTNQRDAEMRSTLMSERIRQRADDDLRELVADFNEELAFEPLDDLMISERAWEHILDSVIEPRLVFAHPDLLQKHPQASQYYRGIALLPQKRVADIASPVATWEDGSRKRPNYGRAEPESRAAVQLGNLVHH